VAVNDEAKISYLNLNVMKFGGSGSTFERKINDHGNQFDSIYSQGSISFKLDDLLEETKTIPNYIKIDVDGNELKVVKGMTKIIQNKNLKSICIELNPGFNEHAEVFEILKKYFKGYSKGYRHQGQEVFNHIFYKI
jgi:FkbM family methyltransferase